MWIGRRDFLAGAGAALLAGPARAGATTVGGPAFGSYWRCVLPAGAQREAVAHLATGLIADLEAELSPWRDDSALSGVNRAGAGDWRPVGAATLACLSEAEAVRSLTEGGFDGRVGPLVARHGFGRIEGALAGEGRFELRGGAVRKSHAGLTFDPCGLAKGHALDLLVAGLAALGLSHALVEIGGEVATLGRHPSGRAWRLAIERADAPRGTALRMVRPCSLALATSAHAPQGLRGRVETSHVIDPRQGRPAAQGLAQVSVLASTGLRADALATGLLALGPHDGPRIARAAGIAALFVHPGGAERMTGGLAAHLIA
ncbi:MAG: thiamine biosynthesis lipoprotein [Limimaricola cinnabarinus]|jgi:thiamine biosynthesis lipoprotein|uniref:FAD:protein FMN transferase n=1 Tax=Limimaricola cinnabarinus TaxID=1125964 RepID=UPI0039E43314